ncbi:Mannan polymerase complex subunit mnn9 [Neolecta irregularis DAH-3]|uniref:Mannan polymerase complex subunit mnn9 n=1 Tax=Neolecta irregularis (strain DAH-3) TaxID=1198029 RepID=A0A1U7LT98_NEOID|nr:Mannan polymerase complex subunit mnn9 [Neolecta irregularis DAH-3]|eukprot:OLL25741.1 Mannan polymerase complex subunit mnn9 [Neolecta irregularis DAH-3]
MYSTSRRKPSSRLITFVFSVILAIVFIIFLFVPSGQSTKPWRSNRVGTGKINRYFMSNLTTTSDPIRNRERVLLLTPLARFHQGYWDNLLNLDYPRELIELGFILPNGKEGETPARELSQALQKVQTGSIKSRFPKVTVLSQDFGLSTSQIEAERHALKKQKDRRSGMAKARNSLLLATLNTRISWVLWLDSDIIETPRTLIQDLAKHNKDIITPNCFQRFGGNQIRPFDFNNWHESDTAIDLMENMSDDEVVFEGYADIATYRLLMVYEREAGGDPNVETMLDGVGGTSLLVKANVHRDGAVFPTIPFYHLIETEGFAKMAKRLGYQPWGLPNYLVYHCNE